jgi:outer membrane lipoprotein LolB
MERKEQHLKQIHLILLMFFLFISGCAQRIPPQDAPQTDWRSQLEAQKNWKASGKVAFIAPDDRQSVNFNWQLEEGRQHLILSSFIGTQLLELIEHEHHSEMAYQDEQYIDQSGSELIARLSGFQLPFEKAPLWLTGAIRSDNNQYDPQSRLKSARWTDEQGKTWLIDYQSYQMVEGFWVPKRISLTQDKLRIKIQLNSWQFNND